MWILRKAGFVRHGVRRENRIISRRARTPGVRVTRWILFKKLTEVQVFLKEAKRRLLFQTQALGTLIWESGQDGGTPSRERPTQPSSRQNHLETPTLSPLGYPSIVTNYCQVGNPNTQLSGHLDGHRSQDSLIDHMVQIHAQQNGEDARSCGSPRPLSSAETLNIYITNYILLL